MNKYIGMNPAVQGPKSCHMTRMDRIKKKKNLLTIMASKEWLLITTVKLKIVVKSTEIHLKYAHIVTPQQGFVFALYSGFFYKKL